MLSNDANDNTPPAFKLRHKLEGPFYSDKIEWSIDGRYLVAISQIGPAITVWDVQTGQLESKQEIDQKYYRYGDIRTVWSPNWHPLVAIEGNYIDLLDVQTGQYKQRLAGHTSKVNCVAWRDRQTLASGSDDKIICLWDIRLGSVDKTLRGHTAPIKCMAWSQDKRTLASGSDKIICLWDMHTV